MSNCQSLFTVQNHGNKADIFKTFLMIEYCLNIIACLLLTYWLFISTYCHGAHTREEQGHADEDVNSNNNI